MSDTFSDVQIVQTAEAGKGLSDKLLAPPSPAALLSPATPHSPLHPRPHWLPSSLIEAGLHVHIDLPVNCIHFLFYLVPEI